jgi:hypothetical protein
LDFSNNQRPDCDWQKPKVDFKMANLKLRICGWLHEAWIEVKAMKLTITKGWDKTCITRVFLLEF